MNKVCFGLAANRHRWSGVRGFFGCNCVGIDVNRFFVLQGTRVQLALRVDISIGFVIMLLCLVIGVLDALGVVLVLILVGEAVLPHSGVGIAICLINLCCFVAMVKREVVLLR